MIIQIAGTSGSGKTHVVRQLMEAAKSTHFHFITGRKTPIGYDIYLPQVRGKIYVLGSYDNPTGGCDTIKSVKDIYSKIEEQYALGNHVVFEGLFAMNQTRGPALSNRLPLRTITVLLLTTPLATCFASIDVRRAYRGADKLPVERTLNTQNNYVRARNYTARMRDAGAAIKRVSREEALPCLLDLLDNSSGV